VIWITISLGLLAIVGYSVKSIAFPSRILFTETVQLTSDGEQKVGLVTDGRTIYFGEHKDSRIVLSSIPTEGGPVRTIPTPFVQVVPVDISPDGKDLLVLAWEGIELERALWIVPLSGGRPHQVGNVRCHSAAWSPDRHRIAFASQNAIYMTVDDGTSIQQIQSFDATPEYVRWSLDGRRLRFDLRDRKGVTFSYWELTFSDHDNASVSSLVPLQAALKDCWTKSMTLDEGGRSFVGGGKCGQENIYLLAKRREPWNSNFDLLKMNSMIDHLTDLTLDRSAKRVFVLGDYAGPKSGVDSVRLDVLRFNVHSFEFSPFLPGISADYVDFSRDGRLIAYIREPDQTLWISRSDGSAARQIATQASHLELPRWSPDGRWLAFMAQSSGKPWRIFVVSTNGESPREASLGADNQGAPTWSPDGKWLVYGNVECQEEGTCAIHKIEISTGKEYAVPGSEGLGTARWSPNGRYIAALNPVGHEVMVFDVAAQLWRNLVDNVNGNDLSWSVDSQYLYASRPAGNQPEILRISLKNSKAETAVDLRSFSALTGQIGKWFALAPDGSILFSREMAGNEIYSLSYAEK
jgi:Tol biopolymer transport system component